MKVVIAPDSFKGSLSAAQAARAMKRGIQTVHPEAEIVMLPLSDGGEGLLEALLAASAGGRRIPMTVTGPRSAPVEAAYGLLGPDGAVAVVETAQAAGLGLVPLRERDPRRTTTFGAGELLRAAGESGATEVVIGLGGSATNDGGAGAMQALGAAFIGRGGIPLPGPITGADLARLERIDMGGFRFPAGVRVRVASDVTSVLLGPDGASAVYGPQKGATPEIVAELDAALSRFSDVVKRDLGEDVAGRPGAGAAGGLGAGLMAFLGAEMHSGITLVLEALQFDRRTRGADWVLTGEGRIDRQTARGKAISGVLAHCKRLGVPVIAFGGGVDEGAAGTLLAQGLRAAFPIVSGPMGVAEAMRDGARLLEDAVARVARLLTPTEPPS